MCECIFKAFCAGSQSPSASSGWAVFEWTSAAVHYHQAADLAGALAKAVRGGPQRRHTPGRPDSFAGARAKKNPGFTGV